MSQAGAMILGLLGCLCVLPAALAGDGSLPAVPVAPKRPVTDEYWGVPVVDDYQYMENMQDPVVQHWAQEEDAYTRAWLDSHPDRARILDRVVALTHDPSPDYSSLVYRPGLWFAIKREPPREQRFLVVLPSLSDTTGERVVVDPNRIDPSGLTTIDFYTPSLDGAYVAVSLSRGGTENGTLHVYETATGHELPDSIPRVNGGTAGGSAAWNAGGTGFYYTRYPRPGERPAEDLPFYQEVWFHKLGDPPEKDSYVIGKEFPKIAEIAMETSRDGAYVLLDVSNGDGGEHAFWVLSKDKPPAQISRFEDKLIAGRIDPDDSAWFLSRADAPNGKLVRLDLGDPDLSNAATVIPQGENAIEEFAPGEFRIYVVEMAGGPTLIRVYDHSGGTITTIEREMISDFSGLASGSGDEVIVRNESFTTPPAWFLISPKGTGLEPTALTHTSPADFSDCEVRREFATAEDGTRIPVNILLRKGTPLDGGNPTILYGYGSYGISQSPHFAAEHKIWLERGGIYVVANIRGGGEFGEAWHLAANLGHKEVSMDDMAACARYLVEKKYTSPERLAIEGGSAGGLLAYGVMVHYPQLMRAVVASVGYGDVLRTELSPNGLFNTTEFGTVKNEEQFRAMLAYSPYHHIEDGVAYPALLATTGLNDPRVEPWQSFKMVARLQATGTPNPILLRTEAKEGHGIGAALTVRDQETADRYTFLFAMLGVSL